MRGREYLKHSVLLFSLALVIIVGRNASGEAMAVSATNKGEITNISEAELFIKDNLGIDSELIGMVDSVRIPKEFNSIYEDYNKLQMSVGYNLLDYKGKEVTRYIFDAEDRLRISLLVHKEKLIGGDISKKQLNSEIYPLEFYHIEE